MLPRGGMQRAICICDAILVVIHASSDVRMRTFMIIMIGCCRSQRRLENHGTIYFVRLCCESNIIDLTSFSKSCATAHPRDLARTWSLVSVETGRNLVHCHAGLASAGFQWRSAWNESHVVCRKHVVYFKLPSQLHNSHPNNLKGQ